MYQPTLYLLMGLPGAGKTTTARILSEVTGAKHLSSDALRAEMFPQPAFDQKEHDELYELLDKQAEKLLASGRDVVYDANLNRRHHRQEKYEICQRTKARPLLLWVQTPKDLAKTRAADLSRQHLWPKNETADSMFDRIAGVIEEPVADEPHTVVDGTKISAEYLKQLLELE